jgi:ABC-2 type transport system permease protein
MRRTMSAPLSTRQAITGQALGRLVIAAFQGGYIMVGTALLFDVDWGNIPAAVAVLLTFGLVAAGAAMVIGSVMDNESAAAGIGIGGGLVLAALGGCMVPLEIFPDTLQAVAHVTPHAWAYEAFAEIQRHGGTIVDVLPQLGVLAAMAAVLLLAGAVLLRRSLERAI